MPHIFHPFMQVSLSTALSVGPQTFPAPHTHRVASHHRCLTLLSSPSLTAAHTTFPALSALQIVLPAQVTGENALLDPRVRGMREELEEINRKLTTGDLGIPPEGQRSPSPEPVYDKLGVRLNTREIRAREKLIDQRHKWVKGREVGEGGGRRVQGGK